MASKEMLKKLEWRTMQAEQQLQRLAGEIDTIERNKRKGKHFDPDHKHSEKYVAAAEKNARLRFQLKHLNDAIAREGGAPVGFHRNQDYTDDLRYSYDVQGVLKDVFALAVFNAFGLSVDPVIEPCSGKIADIADYQCNDSMALCKKLKGTPGVPSSPKEVAERIISELPHSPLIQEVSVAGPGFINIRIKDSFIVRQLAKIVRYGVLPPKVKKQRVIVDFSSPNIAKEMHVGHLRSTIIGDFFARLMEYCGNDTQRINHLGDWGTQFGMLIAHLKDKFPNYATVSPPIGDLQAFYKESKKRFDEDPAFNKLAHDEVVKLQNGEDQDVIKAWKLICDVSLKELNEVYRRLDTYLTPKGESFYQSRMVALVSELEKDKLLEDDTSDEGKGRKIMFTEGSSVPLIIVKSDGGFTYDTSDLATIRYRIQECQSDWLIYVVDSGQSVHLQNVFRAAEKLGWSKNTRVDHVGFGVVLGTDNKKFKTRSGETVRLRDLLDEGVQRAQERLKDNKVLEGDEVKKTAEALAYACIKYADLSHNRTGDYVFDFDKMLSDKGNTACYLLYTYTRIKSIFRQPEVSQIDVNRAALEPINLADIRERRLAFHLARFGEVVNRILKDLFPHLLCDYVYELCGIFTDFYDNLYVIEREKATGKILRINTHRVVLADATVKTIGACFNILGIRPVEKM